VIAKINQETHPEESKFNQKKSKLIETKSKLDK